MTEQNNIGSANKAKLPFIVLLVAICTLIADLGGEGVLGYNISGLAWVIPLAFAVIAILSRPTRIRYPFALWIPWGALLLINLVTTDFPALQRTAQLLCPIIVGMAVSTLHIHDLQLKKFIEFTKHLCIAILMIVAFKTGILLTGQLPMATGLAAEVMTVMLFSTLYANSYILTNSKKDLLWWGILASVPVIAITRTAILATGLTFPLAFAPMRLWKRVILLVLICVIGIALFYSPRIQRKSFYSGKGELSDVFGKNFSTNARKFMWERMRSEVEKEPWYGHGTGAGESFVRKITKKRSGYPHNDWLLTQYDQGYIGMAIYALCLFLAATHAYKRAYRTKSKACRLLFLAGASSFVPYVILMYTDNIMVYASFFGNMQFTFLGVAYAAYGTELAEAARERYCGIMPAAENQPQWQRVTYV